MDARSTNRAAVEDTIATALDRLTGPAPPAAAAADPTPARTADALRVALNWMREREPALAADGTMEDVMTEDEYVSSHPAVALVQSAMEEAGHAAPPAGLGAAAGPRLPPLKMIVDLLKHLDDPLPPFLAPQPPAPIAEKCTIAIVGDWGTGNPGAVRVAAAMRNADPDHVIHLGDVYHTGTAKEVRKKFLDVLRLHGPPETAAKYWAIPGNHEMYSKGEGFYRETLPFCRDQRASCFALENAHWRFVALDTAYHEHDLFDGGQHAWLRGLLRDGGARKTVLVSHHQLFSRFDGRPSEARLRATIAPLLAGADVFAWFWGHEHRGVIYDPSPEFPFRARCVGHGGKDVGRSTPKPSLPSAPVRTLIEAPDAGRPGRIQNGFALLRLDGARIEVSFVDETGFEWHPETWD